MKKRGIHLSLSLVVFFVLLIYMIVNVLAFAMKTKLQIYEVQAGVMTDKISTTGLVVRQEKVITSKTGGYINYYVPDLSKVYKGETLYSLDTTGEIKNYIAEEIIADENASDQIISNLSETISEFKEDYEYSDFEDVYSLKQRLDNAVLSSNGQYIDQTLKKIQKKYGEDAYQIQKSADSGIISFSYDDFDIVKAKEVKAKDFNENKYVQSRMSSNDEIQAGDAVYRMVDSENWQIVILLEKDEYEQLKDRSSVNLTFLQDDIETSAEIEIEKKDGKYFGYLSLSQYMIRYINDRYLDIEISLTSDSGYKIPKSSVVKNEFYQVPVEYLTRGGNSSSSQVLEKTENEEDPVTKNYTIYKLSKDKEEYFYLAAEEVKEGTVLCAGNGSDADTIELRKTVTHKGVYSVNQGYAKFRMIEELRSDDEFLLIASDTVQGVSLYDHIVYDGSDIDENDVIY